MKANLNFLSKCILATYAVVLRCYPSTYREQFGELMLQAVKDELRHSRQQSANQIAITLIKDISLSLPREHYAFESQQGFARKSFLLLLILLTGLFVAREPLQQFATNSFESIARIPESFQEERWAEYNRYNSVIAQDMLLAKTSSEMVAGVDVIVGYDWLYKMSVVDRESAREALFRAIASSANDPSVLFNAHRICTNNPDFCDPKPLLANLRTTAPENAMTWLLHAAQAKTANDLPLQLSYLNQAIAAATYRNYLEVNKIRYLEHVQKKPFTYSWYQRAFNNDAKSDAQETMEIYAFFYSLGNPIPSCSENSAQPISAPIALEIQTACQTLAIKLLKNNWLDFQDRVLAYVLAAQTGDAKWQALKHADESQRHRFSQLIVEKQSVANNTIKLANLQEIHDAFEQGKVDALVRRVIEDNPTNIN